MYFIRSNTYINTLNISSSIRNAMRKKKGIFPHSNGMLGIIYNIHKSVEWTAEYINIKIYNLIIVTLWGK